MKRFICSILLLGLFPCSTYAQITINPIPGGVVEIPITEFTDQVPAAYFGQQRVLVYQSGQHWTALIGLSLDLAPGNYMLEAKLEKTDEPLLKIFSVYPRKRADLTNLQKLPLTTRDRIELTWRDSLDAVLPLTSPVGALPTNTFGETILNAESVRYSDFISFNLYPDNIVVSPGKGEIYQIIDNSNTEVTELYIWIDHGMGLFSRIGPLNETNLELGQKLEKNQPLGEVIFDLDNTQKQQIFWSVFLNGTAIDPALLSILFKESLINS